MPHNLPEHLGEYRQIIDNVCAAAMRLWERPAHRYAVDHGPAHAARVVALLNGLTEGLMQRREYALAAEEIAILLGAAHLHAIGLQAEQIEPDPVARGDRYPELGAELIYRALEDPAEAVQVGIVNVDSGLIELIALVVAGHRLTDFPSPDYDDFLLGSDIVRPRLLAALLHLADVLDLDYRRVDLAQLRLLAVTPEQSFDWWLHHYVSGVQVVDENVYLGYRIPQNAPEYEAALPNLVEHTLQAAFAALRETFRLYGVKVDIAPPTAVRPMRAVKPMPAEIWVAAERRLADLRGAKPETTALPELVATVQGLLETMGYTCAETCTAIVPTSALLSFRCAPQGGLRSPLLVGCQIAGPLTPIEVAVLADELASPEQGYLVAEARVLESARQIAEATGGRVRVFTLNDFYHELLDFRTYAQRLVDDYEKSNLARVYVDLGIVSYTYSVHGELVSEDHAKPLDDYLDDWLQEREGRNHISILGDYGTGKTSFCQQYAAKQARRWLKNPSRERLPILISLREYTNTPQIEGLIINALINGCGIHGATFDAFNQYNSNGKLLLLFDGFDEMVDLMGVHRATKSFWELARVAVPGSKVILTTRANYFRNHREAEDLYISCSTMQTVVSLEKGDIERKLIEVHGRPNFEILYLEPFSDTDIQELLQKCFPEQWEEHWKQIQAVHDLSDLARRPVLLDMIIKTLPRLQGIKTLNLAQLYQLYTERWLDRETYQGHILFTAEQRRDFAEDLALLMLGRIESNIRFEQLSQQVQTHFKIESLEQIERFVSDICTHNFLDRDTEGNYSFVHKSFMEFFVACRLHRLMLNNQATVHEKIYINEEIRLFLNHLFALQPKIEPKPPSAPLAGFVWIPPGEFVLGGAEGLRLQIFRLSEGFFMSKTLVTNQQYAEFLNANGYARQEFWSAEGWSWREREHWITPEFWQQEPVNDPLQPVTGISYYEAQAYCHWFTSVKLLSLGWVARLPTEQEWEKAARGVDGRQYPWGEWRENCANVQVAGMGHPNVVGFFSSLGDSPYGVADMAGNVWEWTVSIWGESQVLRGGSFNVRSDQSRCAYRYRDLPRYRYADLGFRLVIVPA